MSGQFQTTASQLVAAFNVDQAIADAWAQPFNDAMAKYGIASKLEGCAFLANICHETNGLKTLVENLNYSADGLANTWPTRYATQDASGHYLKITNNTGKLRNIANPLASRLAHNPMAIANNVYANRMGNGDEASGDGWKYRAQGPIQLTGKENISKAGVELGIDLVTHPELLQAPEAGAPASAHFWQQSGAAKFALKGDFDGACDEVNIGHKTDKIGDAIGYADRSTKYQKALTVYPD